MRVVVNIQQDSISLAQLGRSLGHKDGDFILKKEQVAVLWSPSIDERIN